jgi:hypothetical protein
MLAGSWMFFVTGAAAIALQALAPLRNPVEYRCVVVGVALATMVWALRLRRDREPSTVLRVCFAFASALALWLGVLELLMSRTIVLALGVLGVLAGAMLHGTLLLALTGRRDSPRGGLALRACFSLTVLALLLWGLEAVIRTIMPPQLYVPVPDDPSSGPMIVTEGSRNVASPGFRGKYVHPEFAGTRVEINAWGMREDADEASTPAPEDFSVLALGDSFVFGTGVEQKETFHELLEADAERITDRRLRVFGAGVPGTSPYHAVTSLLALAERTQPDVVVMGVFEGNDFQDSWYAERQAPQMAAEVARDGDLAGRKPLDVPEFLSGIGRFRYWGVTSSVVQATRLDLLLVNLGLVDPIAHANLFFDQCLLADPPEIVRSMRARVVARLVEMRAACASLSAELVVLLIADAVQVDERLFDAYPLAGDSAGVQYSRLGFHRQFVSDLEREGLLIVDTLPRMEAEAAAGRSCYHHEGHWNAHGHAVAAELLAPVLSGIAGRSR